MYYILKWIISQVSLAGDSKDQSLPSSGIDEKEVARICKGKVIINYLQLYYSGKPWKVS